MTFALGDLSPTRLSRRLRLLMAQKPWIRWITVGAIATAGAVSVHGRLEAVDAARAEWAERVRVPVATGAHEPGDRLGVDWREVPAVAVPDETAFDVSPEAVVRQRIGRGEIVVESDLATGPGPAAGAEPGEVVVPIQDPLVTHARIGLDVAVYSDGIALTESAKIVYLETEVVFVAVHPSEAPMVAAAAQARRATIAFLRGE